MLTLLILPLFLSYHFTVSALTLPSMITNLTAEVESLNDGNRNSEAHCAQNRPTKPLPLFQDCNRAIRTLPQSPYVGTFHIGDDASFFNLPHSRSHGSCTVLVMLHEDFDVELDSWDDIGNAAVVLLLTCRLPFEEGGEQRTGGWITSGAENGVVVNLKRSRYGVMNETGLGAQRGADGSDIE